METIGRVFRGANAQYWEARKQQVREGFLRLADKTIAMVAAE
jgi:hypothetical protein